MPAIWTVAFRDHGHARPSSVSHDNPAGLTGLALEWAGFLFGSKHEERTRTHTEALLKHSIFFMVEKHGFKDRAKLQVKGDTDAV